MRAFQITEQHEPHFLTLTTVGWIDVFTRPAYRTVIFDSLRYCQRHKGLVINAYVIMSNHLHLVAYTQPPFRLSDVLRDFKSFTAKQLLSLMQEPRESRRDWMELVTTYHARFNQRNSYYQFWQQHNRAMIIYSTPFALQKINYIHQNPVRAGWVEEDWHYYPSSARNYLGRMGALEVEVVEGYLLMG